ncbi:MAG: hypothetical protein AB1486_06100 [Planctomycetota bacterium]
MIIGHVGSLVELATAGTNGLTETGVSLPVRGKAQGKVAFAPQTRSVVADGNPAIGVLE